MRNSTGPQSKTPARRRSLIAAALAFGSVFGTIVHAQNVKPPATPDLITPEEGNSAFLVGHAVGTQGYVCLPTSAGASTASWTVNNARPEATLFVDHGGNSFQVVTHFLSPNENPNGAAPPVFGSATWQSSFDSSKVWAQVLGMKAIPASAGEPSCPNVGSIACLLLQTVGSLEGPTGGTLLSKTTFIQRLNTNGGSAPAEGCVNTIDVGKQALVPYTADYVFFRRDKNK